MKYLASVLLAWMPLVAHAQSFLESGRWRVMLQLNDSTELPFGFDAKDKTIEIINAEERIVVDEIQYSGDSVVIKMPVFDSELRGKFSGEYMTGVFLNHARKDNNVIPFKAEHRPYRFADLTVPAAFDMTGRWEVRFAADEPPLDISVGEFKQHDNYLTGTFLTSTGDYRYLEGAVKGNQFMLSCFDGSHLFLFTGKYNPDGTLRGDYYSGKHWHDTWTARRNDHAALPDADTLTYLKPGYDHIDFQFPDMNGNTVSLHDKKFENKIIIIQIMGTWCPNCMDETAFLSPFYKKYKDKGVEIIALDFERMTDPQTVKQNLLRLKTRYQVDYTMLFAGSTDTELRRQALPMLNNILSFPTTIFIDRHNTVKRIHTGFSGPATGAHYQKWQDDFMMFVDRMIIEK